MSGIKDFSPQDRIAIKLLDNHTYFLIGDIEETMIADCMRWLVYENCDSKEKTLTLYINSGGGDLYQAFALIDLMNVSKHPIRVVGMGAVMSAAFLIFASGTKGERYAGPNTSFMCHQFSSANVETKYHDMKAEMKENESLNVKMVTILEDATGLDSKVIKKKLLPASDVYLNSEEVITLGVADYILDEFY
jgi:ATP-dependent Clp protease protease subunit